MSLTLGTGPLSSKPRGSMNARIDGPAHTLYFEPFERRMRAVLDGETVIDTTGGMLLYESNIGPVLYVPLEKRHMKILLRGEVLIYERLRDPRRGRYLVDRRTVVAAA